MTTTLDSQPFQTDSQVAAGLVSVSIVIEWANTELNGLPRAKVLLDLLGRQWVQILRREYPDTLAPEAARFLEQLQPRVQVLIISATPIEQALETVIRGGVPAEFDLAIDVVPGLEYYAMKNRGAQLATGELLMFVDSDVEPEPGWLAHLLGTFADPEKQVVCGQTYIPPDTLYSAAFALGWTYDLRDPHGRIIEPVKYYANNIVFRTRLFQQTGFADLGMRSRGAATLLRQTLDTMGVKIYENRGARVGHPPPANFQHLVIRALAHGRDHCMKYSQNRTLYGVGRSVWVDGSRLCRGFQRTFRHFSEVGLKFWQIPAVLAIISCYYFFFALGGILTFVSPSAMSRRFRV